MERLVIERDVARLVHQFFDRLDAGDFEALIALLAPDAAWHRQGKMLKGHGQVREALAQRPAGVTTRHLVTNLLVDAAGADSASATYYMTAFRHDGDRKAEGPVPLELPFAVALYTNRFVRTGAGWRIAEISGRATFKR